MEDSTMDFTAVCYSADSTKRDLILMHEKNEQSTQENYELKKKIELLEKVNADLENELLFSSNGITKEKSKQANLQNELDCAYAKIKQLESTLDEERMQFHAILKEPKEKKEKEVESNVGAVHYKEELEILTGQIVNLEALREEDHLSIKQLLEEKDSCVQTIFQFKSEKQHLLEELADIKEHLNQKSMELKSVNETLETTREEKFLLNTELQMLKASDGNAARGNSLFAEVEENRQKVAAQREVLKLKYLNLKKVLSQRQVEINKLKLEIVKIRREEKDDEKTIHRDYSNLIGSYKERVSDLEKRNKELEQKNQQPPIIVGADNAELRWVHTVVENARKEARNLQSELDSRSSNYVMQGHQLFDSQKDNRKLKAIILKLQSEIDELRLKLDTIKAANENVDDGISPPATEIAIEYQKQKMVKFKEVLHERSANNSLPEDKESNKEN